MKLVVINGPNLNHLGKREPEIYGTRTLDDLDAMLIDHAGERGVELDTFQNNSEGAIIDRIQAADGTGGDTSLYADAILINPGAYTHTSLAIADAIRGVHIPVIEVHLSNVQGRGELRSRSLVASACVGQISGFGFESYRLAIDAAISVLKS
jgi:3-dehydroquinate dehydratase-2